MGASLGVLHAASDMEEAGRREDHLPHRGIVFVFVFRRTRASTRTRTRACTATPLSPRRHRLCD